MEFKSPSKSKIPVMGVIRNFRTLTIGLAILAFVLLTSVGGYFMLVRPSVAHFLSKDSFFTVVLDCGSTGTRVNVYEWVIRSGASNGNLPVLLRAFNGNSTEDQGGCLYHCMQTVPGLDKFVGNASGVRASLEPLIRKAEKWVPLERHADTPIFVLATAGLRKLSMKDVRQVLGDVEAVVKEHKFMNMKSWIRVLSGKEEAYYGWVALNHQMGFFENSSRLTTLGLLDLGGSSLQVVTERDELNKAAHILRPKIGSVEYQILAYSLPAFGINEAFDRTVIMLSHTQAIRESAAGLFEVIHPCIGSGFVQNYTCHGCFGTYSSTENFNGQIGENEFNSVSLIGNPNWEQCKILARAAATNSSEVDLSLPTNLSNCSGSKMLQLMANTSSGARFHALSAFFAVYNTLNLGSRANMTEIWVKGQQLCSRSWADLNSIPGNPSTAGQHCFRVMYLASLIEDALCLDNTEIIFGPGDISWTLGAALIEGEFLWHNSRKSQRDVLNQRNNGVISSPIFVFIFLSFLLFIVYRYRIKLPMPSRKVAAAGISLPSFIFSKRLPV